MSRDLQSFLHETQARVNQSLEAALLQQKSPYLDEQDPRILNFIQAAQYSISNGGKRLRPALVYATVEALGGAEKVNIIDSDLDIIAAALECIHSYSLVHDDLPAMDDDDLRRGKPTCHIAFDEATAILVGDGLQALAFELLCDSQSLSAQQQLALVKVLAQASGNFGMVGGQAIDLAAENTSPTLEQMRSMHSLKTGALIRAAMLMAAVAMSASDAQAQALDTYADKIGLAFQIQDDILDIESDTDTLGKQQGSDAQQNKATYPALMGLPSAKEKAQKLVTEAKLALKVLDGDVSILCALADFIVQRRF